MTRADPASGFLWCDFETFGTDPWRDWPAQFAAVETDLSLKPGQEYNLFCQVPEDQLPHPEACLVTGLTPEDCNRKGVPDYEFAATIQRLQSEPGTVTAGYNLVRFDRQFCRQLFWRNFIDPYRSEWANGNSVWDLIDLTRMTAALRPDGINWPTRTDGSPSFRLQDLACANNIIQQNAHNALDDVYATIGLARLLRDRQPRLFDWMFSLRRKEAVRAFMARHDGQLFLHVSGKIPASRHCIGAFMVLASYRDEWVVADLAEDIDHWCEADADELKARLFAPAGVENTLSRPRLKSIRANRCPALAPWGALRPEDASRLGWDIERIKARYHRLLDRLASVRAVIHAVFDPEEQGGQCQKMDAELALYSGFVSNQDRKRCQGIAGKPPETLAGPPGFQDERLQALWQRYQARHARAHLSPADETGWRQFLHDKLIAGTHDCTSITFDQLMTRLGELKVDKANDPAARRILDSLEHWAKHKRAEMEEMTCRPPGA
jgi:exodeoxyribonuclease-1